MDTCACVNTRTSTAQRLLLAGWHRSVCRPRSASHAHFRHRQPYGFNNTVVMMRCRVVCCVGVQPGVAAALHSGWVPPTSGSSTRHRATSAVSLGHRCRQHVPLSDGSLSPFYSLVTAWAASSVEVCGNDFLVPIPFPLPSINSHSHSHPFPLPFRAATIYRLP